MRLTKLSIVAVVAISLISMDALAARVDRKFHPVVNDDPQNAHLNVQTPGADINQTVVISEEPGPDGQVIPAGETKVASCAVKGAGGDIDLSAVGSCVSSTAAQVAERAPASTTDRISSPRAASPTSSSLALPSFARAGNASASAPNRAGHAIEGARVAAPLPAHRTENARAVTLSRPGKQLAPAMRADVALYEFARMRWLEIGLAAAMLVALGLGLMIRMGLADLLLMRRERGEEHAARDGRTTVSAVAHDPLPSP
jgi:hypothetical protein